MSAVEITVDSSKLDLRLKEMPQQVHDALVVAVTLDAGELQGEAQSLAEQVLRVRSGKFVGSIKSSVRENENHITGRVYSNAPQANLFEYGGTTPPHDIEPNTARALAFLASNGGLMFAASVHHPGGKYRALEILHTAFDTLKSDIAADLTAAVDTATAGVIE